MPCHQPGAFAIPVDGRVGQLVFEVAGRPVDFDVCFAEDEGEAPFRPCLTAGCLELPIQPLLVAETLKILTIEESLQRQLASAEHRRKPT